MKDLIEIGDKGMTYSSFHLSKNGLEALGSPSFDDWVKCGDFLKNANGAVHFWIGDWLRYGEKKYGETYAQAIDQTGYDYLTLSNDKWVASRIDPSRRRDTLSFSHHQEVADLAPEEQDKMLDEAEDKSLNRTDFRKLVRGYKLKLDLPELSEQQIAGSSEDFDRVTLIVGKLIEVTEDIKAIPTDSINTNARDFLLSQIKKSFGVMGGVLSKYERE